MKSQGGKSALPPSSARGKSLATAKPLRTGLVEQSHAVIGRAEDEPTYVREMIKDEQGLCELFGDQSDGRNRPRISGLEHEIHSRAGVIEASNEGLLVEARATGRMTFLVTVVDRRGDRTLHVDAINPATARHRERFVQAVGNAHRKELTELLLEIARRSATRSSVPLKAPIPTSAAPFRTDDPWPEPVSIGGLLPELVKLIESYVVLPPMASFAIALWLVHTYVADVADYTPYLLVTSPTRQCGKTTLLELLSHLAFRAIKTDGYTAAALYRRIEQSSPTLLLDELDTRLRGDHAEPLRGVLNSGFHRPGKVTICAGDDHEPRDFRTYCPKVLAGIGRPWDTVTSRSIPVRMMRARKDEMAGKRKIKGHLIANECMPYRRRLLRWANDYRDAVLLVDPEVPDELGARQADVWRQLLAIADLTSNAWSKLARQTAKTLHAVADQESDPALLLLEDVRRILGARHRESHATNNSEPLGIATEHLLTELHQAGDDRPWAEYKDGKPITARQLANLLQGFEIKPHNVRAGSQVKKGYAIAALYAAIERYLPTDTDTAGYNPSDPLHPLHALSNSLDTHRSTQLKRKKTEELANADKAEPPARTTMCGVSSPSRDGRSARGTRR